MYVIWMTVSLSAGTAVEFPLGNQSTPELNIRVYGFPGLSGWVLRAAYTEAERLLSPVSIDLKWVECTPPLLSTSCTPPRLPTDLTVRVMARALSPASANALGMTAWSNNDAAAFVFYDRVLAQQPDTNLLPFFLGRVMAHEIAHLLLPQHEHSDFGLMRARWGADDLRFTSLACLALPSRFVQLMQKEARRRVLIARDLTAK
jgi:hypothetical protein